MWWTHLSCSPSVPSVKTRILGSVALAATLVVAETLTAMAAVDMEDPVLISGDVFSSVSDPVVVSVQVWPNQEVLDALPVGAEVPIIELDDVELAGSSYTARLDPERLPTDYQSDNGAVDVEVVAFNRSGEADSYSETMIPAKNAWRRSVVAQSELRTMGSRRPESPGNMNVGRGNGTTRAHVMTLTSAVEEGLLSPRGSDEPSSDLGESDGLMLTAAAEPICSTSKTSVTHERKAKVSDVMPAPNYMKGKVSYAIGSNHTLGIAVKSQDGSVSAGGTTSRSSQEAVNPVWRGYDHTARTFWKYREYKNWCNGQVTARPESHEGGYYIKERSRPNYKHCKKYAAQADWTRHDHEAWTYSAGLSLFGVNLKSQVGYDSKTILWYSFPDRARWLCGNDANPPSAKLVAGYGSDQG